jgi:hypothetical protein
MSNQLPLKRCIATQQQPLHIGMPGAALRVFYAGSSEPVIVEQWSNPSGDGYYRDCLTVRVPVGGTSNGLLWPVRVRPWGENHAEVIVDHEQSCEATP